MAISKEYKELLERLTELNSLEQVDAILGWDQQTYMPQGAFQMRGQQSSVIAGIAHERLTSEGMGKLIRSLKKQELPAGRQGHPPRDGAQVEESVERPGPTGPGDHEDRRAGLRGVGQGP